MVDSEFSDIFDLDQFKWTLGEDVYVVSSLPSTHLMSRPLQEKRTPLHVGVQGIRKRYLKRVKSSVPSSLICFSFSSFSAK